MCRSNKKTFILYPVRHFSHISQLLTMPLTPSTSASTLIKDGWFTEAETMWPGIFDCSFYAFVSYLTINLTTGQRFSLKVEEVLLNGRSDFQVRIWVIFCWMRS